MSVASYREFQIAASAARTATWSSDGYVLQKGGDSEEGLTVILDLTAFTTAADLVMHVEEWIPTKGAYVAILSTPTINALGTSHLRISPYQYEVSNKARGQLAPRRFRVRVVHGNANSHTYSIDANAWSLR